MEKKKFYKQKWFLITIIVFAVLYVLAVLAPTTTFTSEVTYTTEAVEKGTPTGYTKDLSNGVYVVGEDIEPGLYNISNIGWADLITVESSVEGEICASATMISANEDGTYQNLMLEEGCQVDILDQDNESYGVADTGSTESGSIKFSQVEPETIEAAEVTETLTIDTTDSTETCEKDLEDVECSELVKYDELKADVESQY